MLLYRDYIVVKQDILRGINSLLANKIWNNASWKDNQNYAENIDSHLYKSDKAMNFFSGTSQNIIKKIILLDLTIKSLDLLFKYC